MNHTDPTAAIEVLARLLCAADVHVHDGDHPTWQQLSVAQHGRGQDDYRKAARWLLPRMTVATKPAAASAVVSPPTDRVELRDRIAEALMRWADGNNSPQYASMRRPETVRQNAYSRADAVLAVLPEPTDRAAVLREAYEIAYTEGMRLNALEAEIGVGPYRGALAVAHLLRKAISDAHHMAVEAHGTGTQQPEAKAPDELATARATNQRLNLRAQRLESELAAYRRAVADWEISDRGAYVPLRTLAAIAKAAGLDVPARWELHYERVERLETELRRTAVDEPAPVAQQPAADTCRPVDVDGEAVLVRGSGDMTEQERGYIGEIVRAAKRKYAAEHGGEQQAAAADGEETLCRCGHGRAYHDAKYADPQCRLCPGDGERSWRHPFTPADVTP